MTYFAIMNTLTRRFIQEVYLYFIKPLCFTFNLLATIWYVYELEAYYGAQASPYPEVLCTEVFGMLQPLCLTWVHTRVSSSGKYIKYNKSPVTATNGSDHTDWLISRVGGGFKKVLSESPAIMSKQQIWNALIRSTKKVMENWKDGYAYVLIPS